ncbi:prolyl oligopeptidase family serine peptidase [Tenacibaculum sp. TC6]|uniref:prolyl oligopeptidase family serine peptidase n=1 Tax=Tenacibaculum sp. TC6 TaxID=3423223 RepID=UPI003D368D01
MKKRILILVVLFVIFQCQKKKDIYSQSKLIEGSSIDTLHREIINDPYRYMENIGDSTVLNWYKKQTLYSKQEISKINNREKIIALQKSLSDKNTIKISHLNIANNDKYFYLKYSNNEKVKQLYFRDGFEGKERFLFNPEDYKKGYTINYIAPNWDGSKVAIAITKNDLEIGDIIVFDMKNQKLENEMIENCWPSSLGGIRWLPDNLRFTYEYIPTINKKDKNYLLNIETRLHVVGQNATTDLNVFSKNNNPEIEIKEEDFPEVSFKDENSKYMFASVSGASYYADYYYSSINTINSPKIIWKPLFKKEDLIKRFYLNGDSITYLSAKNAKNFRICRTSLIKPNFDSPEILITEDSLSVITDFALTNKGLFFVKAKNGIEAKLYKLDNKNRISDINIPKKAGSINVSSKGYLYPDLWINIKGWISEKERYVYNHENQNFIEQQLVIKSGYKELLANAIVEEIEVTSPDGVKVPLSLIYKKEVKKDGKNRVLMRGYGAFGYSLEPALNNYLLHWVNEGGIYVIAHVRGGGEKGDLWYKGGYKTTKPNSWKDFIACAEYLINRKYTSPSKLVISSASGGGVLIGRALTERPDLFAAATIRVGVFNTLRSEFAPNGKNLSKEFGSIKDSIEFKALLEMDAYQHIKDNINYPPVYLTGGINDSRVVIWQPGKFAAKLLSSKSKNKVLFNVDFEGGHGFDADKDKKNNELADILSFALWQSGHPDYQLKK